MGRHRLPESQLRESLTLRLPRWLLQWYAAKGDLRKEIEKALLEKHERETNGK